MLIDCATANPTQLYYLLIQTIVPRPIAWVLSDHGNGTYNLAPFSFFNAVCADPPMVMISVGWKDEHTRKDTWTNIEQRPDFVVHIPSGDQVNQVTETGASMPHGASEIDALHLELVKTEDQSLPRLKNAKVALYCQKHLIQEIGNDRQALIFGVIKHIWVADESIQERQGRWIVDPKQLDPLARLGGNDYSLIGDVLTVKRRS